MPFSAELGSKSEHHRALAVQLFLKKSYRTSTKIPTPFRRTLVRFSASIIESSTYLLIVYI